MSKSLRREKLPTWPSLTNEDRLLLCSRWAGGVQRSTTFKDDSKVPTAAPRGEHLLPWCQLHHHGPEAAVESESVAPARADLSRLRGWVTYMGYAPFAEPMKVVWLLRCSLLPSQSSSIGRGPTGWKVLSLEWNNVLFCRHAVAAAHWATLRLGFQREEGFMSLSVCLCFSPFASWGYWIFSHPGAFSEDGILAYYSNRPQAEVSLRPNPNFLGLQINNRFSSLLWVRSLQVLFFLWK